MKQVLYIVLFALFCTGCQKRTIKAGQFTMQPYIKADDRIVIDKTPGKCYDYGDVVVCQFENREDVFYTLRVVGLPGDSLGMEDYTCVINGKKNPRRLIADSVAFYHWSSLKYADEICEEFPNGKKVSLYVERKVTVNKEFEERSGTIIYVPEAFFPSVYIPSGYYYVLADERASAADSRLHGLITKENIRGKVVKVIPSRKSER